ncbi:hypothetical protein V8F06_007117 [Rhypophila decipiens]
MSHLAKLRISNPKNVTAFDSSFTTFLQLLAQFKNSSSTLPEVRYATHSVETVNGRTVTTVSITIPDGADTEFCRAVMEPESDPLVNSVSEHGLLGFSSIDGDSLHTPWNMAVFETCYVEGADRMNKFQLQGLKWFSKRELPMWLQLASFAAGTCIQVSFLSTMVSAGRMGSAGLIAVRQAQKDKRMSWAGSATEAGTQLIRLIAKENETVLSEDDYKKQTAAAIHFLREDMATVCQYMRNMTTNTAADPHNWDKDLPAMFQTLWSITLRTYTAFSLSEELIMHYSRVALIQGSAAISSGISTAACSVQLWLLLQARQAMPTLAPSLMPGILGAVGGVVFGLGSTIYHGVQAHKAHKKKVRCHKLAQLIQQIWVASAEANTLIRWVKTTGQGSSTLVFVHDSGREWEKFLVSLRGAGQVQEEWKKPEFVTRWLNQRRLDLEGLSGEVETQWEVIWT